jgi:hypothetical protein
MAGKVVIRTLLILALIGTAHAIKPFSVKNVTNHLLYSTRSFKFVLPVRLQDNFNHANYLAINLSNSLFEAGTGIRQFTNEAGNAIVADYVAIKVQPLEEVNRSARKQKSGPKRSAPAKRVIKTERSDSPGLIASVNSDEILPVELPPAPAVEPAPVVQPCVTTAFSATAFFTARPKPAEVLLALRKSDGEKREPAQLRLITLIEQAVKAHSAVKLKVEKPGVIASECEEQEIEFVAEEIEIEVAEEEPVAPPQAEEPPSGPLSTPIEKCPQEP